MAKKIYIDGNNLLVQDTITSALEFDVPKNDFYYDWRALETRELIILVDANSSNYQTSQKYEVNLADAVDSSLIPFTKESFQTFVRINLKQSSAIDATVQTPIPVDDDSVYPKDVDFNCSNFGDFVGDNTLIFESPFSSSITNSTSDNPKQIIICFNRTVKALQIGLGENNGGDFSNIKISLLGSGGTQRSIFDQSTDNTKLTSLNAEFKNEVFNSLLIEFYTADPVSISNIIIFKASYDTVQIQGLDNQGNFNTVATTQRASLNVALTEYQGDAFGRLRVSEPYTIFDSSLTTNAANELFWSELLNGTALGTYNEMTSSYTLNVAQNGDYAIRQTKQRFKYQPGKSHEVLITGHLPTSNNIIKRCGLLDYDNRGLGAVTNAPQNGIFFENDSGTLGWGIYNNGVRTEFVTQDSWNIDKCDGSGNSQFVLDINSTNIFFTDLEWLGVGAVRCGFVSDTGEIVVAHQFRHASKGFTDVYMRTANLPVSYEITSNGGIGEMKQICSSVISEGGFNPVGILKGITSNQSGTTISNDNLESLLGIRLNEDQFEYSVDITTASILAKTSGDGRWYLLLNPTLDGTPTWNTEIYGIIENSQTNLDVTDVNYVIQTGTFSSDNDAITVEIENAVKLGKTLAGGLDEIWLCILPYSTETFHGSINIKGLI